MTETSPQTGPPALEMADLTISFRTGGRGRSVQVVRGIDLDVGPGEVMALVGESGCGKSLTALSALGLLPEGFVADGSIRLNGMELVGMGEAGLSRLRGNRISMVFPEPMTALNPVMSVGLQVAEVLERHNGLDRRAALAQAARLFDRVQLSDARARLRAYPFELSGGQRQRVMIAMALACSPSVLIADEPTTALDVTVQAQILDLTLGLVEEAGMALLLITHDLGVVAEAADRVAVMYAGRVVESAPVRQLFASPAHPYTAGLFESLPSVAASDRPLATIPGSVPDPASVHAGCAFAPRCRHRQDVCSVAPELEARAAGHTVACHLARGTDR